MNTMKAQLVRQIAILFSALALCLGTASRAAAPASSAGQSAASGPVSFSFTNSTVPVYDLTGNYQFEHLASVAGGPPVDLLLACSLEQDAAGRLHGTGTTNIQVGTEVLQAQYTVSGKVAGGGGKATRVTLSVRWTGQGSDTVSISVQYNLVINLGSLDGFARGKAKLGRSGTGNFKLPVTNVRLPDGADGDWGLQMNLQGSGGSGAILVGTNRTVQANVSANFAARTGRERLKVTGAGAGRGNTLNLSFVPASGSLESLSGKVLGQTVSLKSAGAVTAAQIASAAAASAAFAGSQACLECHSPIQQTVSRTLHAQVGVQCENCHGPAAAHAANDYDPQSRPIIPYNGATCGTCHSGPRHPIYEEWSQSEHAEVALDLNPPDRITSCGRCHSGSVRVNLLEGTPLPADANVPLGCPTCHQPHQLTGQPNQLRNPLFSTNDYFITTTSVFTNNYNPNINLCAQCHNHRGATWTDSTRPPHESPQYNILLGTVGELTLSTNPPPPSFDPATHAFLTNQCVTCHMPRTPAGFLQPAVTGHQFDVINYAACAGCHGSGVNASNLVLFTSGLITAQMQDLVASLNEWATNAAPPALSAKYGTRAWEYTVPGELSPGGPGPNAAEQGLIPFSIQKARFNLYLVLHDASFGTHNRPYTVTLLTLAQEWVDQELGR